MPSAPIRACHVFGCPQKSPCPQHSRARQHDRYRGSAASRGYDHRWAKAAQLFLDEFPLCGQRPGDQPPVMSRCHDQRRLTPATQVDHVIPHKGDHDRFWDRQGNWQALCASCHARKSQAGL